VVCDITSSQVEPGPETTRLWQDDGVPTPASPPADPRRRDGTPARGDSPPDNPRVLAGRYRLDAVIGKGSMGTVWSATDQVLHRQVAIKEIDFPPGKVGSEHDERESRQEEVYLTLSGAGTLEVDGETVEMKAGRYVLVPPESKRRPAAGPEGMSFLVIGGVPGDVYEPWTPPDE
jgi:quercetin dioxygenase-like cupin family protein